MVDYGLLTLEDHEVLLSAKVWIHGHTHCSCNHRIGDLKRSVLVISNPRGNPVACLMNEYESQIFDPALIAKMGG